MPKPPRINVHCDEFNSDTFARLYGEKYWCANCGATDHEEI